MKKILLLTALFISTFCYSQDYLWSYKVDQGKLIASERDNKGNIYVVFLNHNIQTKVNGVSYGFPSANPLNPSDSVDNNFTILKFNKDGKFIMKSNFIMKTDVSLSDIYFTGITIDKHQNIYFGIEYTQHPWSEILIRQTPSTYHYIDGRTMKDRFLAIKLNANGYFEWSIEYDHMVYGSYSLLEASQNSESLYLTINTDGEGPILYKYDKDGKLIFPCEKGGGLQVADFCETNDGNYFYSATRGGYFQNKYSGYIVKYNTSTGVITQPNIPSISTPIDPNSGMEIYGKSICIDKNDNIYTVGGTNNIDNLFGFKLNPNRNGHIVKFDSDLNPQWMVSANGLVGEKISLGADRIFVVAKASENAMIGEYQFDKNRIVYAEIDFNGKIIIAESYSTTSNYVIVNPGKTSINGALINKPNEFGIIKSAANRITGTVYYDLNSNNQQDIDEDGTPTIRLNINNKPLLSGSTGKYITGADSGVNYIITPIPLKYYRASPTIDSVEFNSTDSTAIKNFALQPVGEINDLEVYLTSISNRARPGFNSVYRITAKNIGTTILNPTIKLTYDSALIFQNSGPEETAHTYPVLTWDFTNFKPGEEKNFTVRFKVEEPPVVVFGDTIIHVIEIDPDDNDTTEDNNKDTLEQIVWGSHDPNIKEVNKPEIIDVKKVNGSFAIDYTIHFQNTGNDTAFYVYLIDSLDKDLKVESIEVLSASHDYEMSISENNALRWDYYNILLVDSNTNEPESHGFIKYRVWTKDNPGLGDEFTNFADIYFDFNAPVRTNTTTNRIDFKESVQLIKGTTIVVYPNPTTDVFTVKADIEAGTKATVEVIDLTGKLIHTENTQATTNGLETQIDINTLPQGIYFIKIYAGNEVYTAKIIKQ